MHLMCVFVWEFVYVDADIYSDQNTILMLWNWS